MSGFFISHVSQEQSVAQVLKQYLHEMFGASFPIFVSSDKTSIGGGKKWFTHIIDSLKGKKVVLCLVSQESISREWINFEAGYGEGHGACIIPVAIRNLPLGAIKYPLGGYQARAIHDLQAIADDISRETGLSSKPVDFERYLADITEAEDKVQYKNVVMRPYKTLIGSGMYLHFEIENIGNTDVELLFAEVTYCQALISGDWRPLYYMNQRDVIERPNDIGVRIFTVRYWTHPGGQIERLVPVLTRSMGPIHLREMNLVLSLFEPPEDSSAPDPQRSPLYDLKYQLHVRGYDTKMETVNIRDIERR